MFLIKYCIIAGAVITGDADPGAELAVAGSAAVT